MKSPLLIVLSLALAPLAGAQIPASEVMHVTSPDIPSGGAIPEQFTCDGRNQSPNLKFTGIPAGAKSLVVIVEDSDAPRGTFTHWLVWNISPDRTEILAAAPPPRAVEGTNDFGKLGYMGPCPSAGQNTYYFRLYALDTMLDLKPGARRQEVDAAMKGHILNEDALTGTYVRKAVENAQ